MTVLEKKENFTLKLNNRLLNYFILIERINTPIYRKRSEFRGVKKHSDKLFVHSVNVHKDFFKLIYHSYGLWIIRKDESRGIKELLENTWLKSNWDKNRIGSQVFAASENGVQPAKAVVEIDRIRFNNWLQKQT